MALMDRIDALPDDMKAICASFAYGYTEKATKHGMLLRSVSAQMCTATHFHIGIWRCLSHGTMGQITSVKSVAFGKKSESLDGKRLTHVHLPSTWATNPGKVA